MKRVLFFGVLAVMIFLACQPGKRLPAATAATGDSITILTYNIHHANPPSRQGYIDVAAIAAVINQQHPQLVALQELDVHTGRSGKTLDEAAAIAALTGMQLYFSKSIDYDGGEYGIAILSKFRIKQTMRYALPTIAGTGGEPRILAMALVELPGKGKCWFACTHLDAQRSDLNRIAQMNAITHIVNQEKWPVILAGDLNALPESSVIQTLDSVFTRTCGINCGFTIPETHPNKTIDYIAFRPAGAFTVLRHQVINGPYASDHLPVLAVIK